MEIFNDIDIGCAHDKIGKDNFVDETNELEIAKRATLQYKRNIGRCKNSHIGVK